MASDTMYSSHTMCVNSCAKTFTTAAVCVVMIVFIIDPLLLKQCSMKILYSTAQSLEIL